MRNLSTSRHTGHRFICPCALFTQCRTGANHQTMPLYHASAVPSRLVSTPALAQGTGNNTLHTYSPSIRQKLCSKIKPDLCELILNVFNQPAICETGLKGVRQLLKQSNILRQDGGLFRTCMHLLLTWIYPMRQNRSNKIQLQLRSLDLMFF